MEAGGIEAPDRGLKTALLSLKRRSVENCWRYCWHQVASSVSLLWPRLAVSRLAVGSIPRLSAEKVTRHATACESGVCGASLFVRGGVVPRDDSVTLGRLALHRHR